MNHLPLPRGNQLFLAAFADWPAAQCLANFRTLLNILQAPRPYKFCFVEAWPFIHGQLSIADNIKLEVGHKAAYGDLRDIIPSPLCPLLDLIPDLSQIAGQTTPEVQHLMAIIIAFWRPGDYVLLERPQFNLPPQALERLCQFLQAKQFSQNVIIHGPRALWENLADYIFWPSEGKPQLTPRGVPPPTTGHLEFKNFPPGESSEVEI